MKLIRMDDEVYEIFSKWLSKEAYPSEHNFPRMKEAYKAILDDVENENQPLDYFKSLIEFHLKYGHYISRKPTLAIPWPIILLRIRLMYEELGETISAMIKSDNLADIADGLADLLYVTFGTAVSYGIPIDEIFREVQRSNMSKSTEKDEYGKTIKGPDWSPPNINKILG